MKHVQTYARKHKLSFIPGGHTVIITDVFGESKVYDKVHYTIEYLTAVLLNDCNVALIEVDKKEFWRKAA